MGVTLQRATVVRYNHLFSRASVTRCCGSGSFYLLWDKGLRNIGTVKEVILYRQISQASCVKNVFCV